MAERAPLAFREPVDARERLRRARVSIASLTAVAFVRRYWAELLVAIAFVVGWLLVTGGLAAIAEALPQRVARSVARAVWLVSLGTLAISAGGWKMLRDFVRDGLYALTKDA